MFLTLIAHAVILTNTVFTPPQDGLILWLDAADPSALRLEDGKVMSWVSKAPGLPCEAVSDTGGRPVMNDNNGAIQRPALSFDGKDDVLRIPSFGQQADTWTLIMVCAPQAPIKGGGLCSACPKGSHDYDPGFTVDLFHATSSFDQISVEGAGRIGGQQDQMLSAYPAGGMHVVAVTRGAEKIKLHVDGKAEGERPAAPATTLMGELRIGARYYAGAERGYFNGEIAQVLLYNRALSDAERQSIETALAVSEEERQASVAKATRVKEERMRNRMKSPRIIQSWPDFESYKAEHPDSPDLAAMPIRKDIREAIELGVKHLNSLYDSDRDDEPFFYANCQDGGLGKMHHSVVIGIPHVVGRCLLACMMAEKAGAVAFPEEGLTILERYCRSSFDNPDNLNSYFDPEKGGARFIEFHNMREGLYSLWALIAGRDSTWARDKAHAMLVTLDKLTDESGTWSLERIAAQGMTERCSGVSVANASRMVDPLLAYYDCTRDPLAMKLAGLYARRGLAVVYTPDGHFAPMAESSGHVHSITSSLSGIADYAARTGDSEMLAACARIMDVGVPDYFSSWGWGDEVYPDHPADEISRGEINQTGDVVRTALTLGAAGYPRFYETAERYLRGMLLPTQHRAPEINAFLRNKENPADDSERNVVERSIGGYAMQHPNDRMNKGDWPVTTLDVTSGAVHAMSECYRQRVVTRDGVCTVNLLFDYDTEDVTILSGLPAEGRIAFAVRKDLVDFRIVLPEWMNTAGIRATLNDAVRDGVLRPGFASFGALKTGDKGEITFAEPCKVEKETVDGVEYTTTWVGGQIIEILPRGEVNPLPF